MIREFNEFERIGEIRFKNVKIICAFDDGSICRSMDDFRENFSKQAIPVINVTGPDKIDELIKQIYIDTNYVKGSDSICEVNFLMFVYNSSNLSLRDLIKYINFVKKNNNIEDIPNFLYFAYRIYFNDSKIVQSFLEKHFNAKIFLDYVFNPETLSYERCSANLLISKICCLLYNKTSVVIKGNRMSGKKTMLSACIGYLTRHEVKIEIEVIHWSEDNPRFNVLNTNVFIMVDDADKKIRESAVQIDIEHKEFYLDCVKYINDHNKTEEKADECSSRLSNSVYLYINETYHHPCDCIHNTVHFDSYYKYIDFTSTLLRAYIAFQQKAEKRQVFLKSGIDRINKFKEEAQILRNSILQKKDSLNRKTEELNNILELMKREHVLIKEEEEKVLVKKIQLEMEIEKSENKKKCVNMKLARVEPLIRESKEAISKISKSHLSEIKVMGSPPKIIKNTIECVYYLLEGRSKIEWSGLLLYIKKEDFVSKVLSYNVDKIVSNEKIIGSNAVAGRVVDDFDKMVSDVGFTFENADKASKACGALFQWVTANIEYKKVAREVIPMKREIEVLDKNIDEQSSQLFKEEQNLVELSGKLTELKAQCRKYEEELSRIQNEIGLIENSLFLLEEVINKMRNEVEEWKYIKYECPIKYMLDNKFIFEYKKNVYYSIGNKKDDTLLSNFIQVSMNDRNYKRVINNSMIYGNDIFIRDVDRFDASIYSLLKSQASRNVTESDRSDSIINKSATNQASRNVTESDRSDSIINKSATNQASRNVTESDRSDSIINKSATNQASRNVTESDRSDSIINKSVNNMIMIQGNFSNYYEYETYKYEKTAEFQLDRISNLKELEDGLLELLTNENKESNLKAIIQQKSLLEEERAIVENHRELSEYLAVINGYYSELNLLFKKYYKIGMSFMIYKEFLEKNNYQGNRGEIRQIISDFYGHTFFGTNLNDSLDNNTFSSIVLDSSTRCGLFDLNEISQYTFDYTFFTSYNDILPRLNSLISFDIEISAGSVENNSKIKELLAEKGNKLILVKNTHFLPEMLKSGSNRFVFIIENNEHHPIIENSRVVYYDRNMSYESIYRDLSAFFRSDSYIIKFHTLLVEMGLDFSLRDLEIALQNKNIGVGYIKEVIYYNRMTEEEKRMVDEKLQAMNIMQGD